MTERADWRMRAALQEWEVGNVVEIAPGLFGQILEVEHTPVGTVYKYKPTMTTSRWTWWQRVKLALGWRPPVGY